MQIRKIAVIATAFLITASPLAYAEETSSTTGMRHPSATDLKALTDARVGIIKAALQMTPTRKNTGRPWRRPSVRERRTDKPGLNGWRSFAIAAQWKRLANTIRSNSCNVARSD